MSGHLNSSSSRLVGRHTKQKAATQVSNKPEMLSANVKIADKAKIEGEEGVEAGGWRLQHRNNVYGPGLAFADSMCSCDHVPHACTPATSPSDASVHWKAWEDALKEHVRALLNSPLPVPAFQEIEPIHVPHDMAVLSTALEAQHL